MSKKRPDIKMNKIQPILYQNNDLNDDSDSSNNNNESGMNTSMYPEPAFSKKVARKRQANTPKRMNYENLIKQDNIKTSEFCQENESDDEYNFSSEPPESIKTKKNIHRTNIPDNETSETIQSILRKKSFISDTTIDRDSLQNDEELQNLIQMLKKQGLIKVTTPQRTVLQDAHEVIKKQRSKIQSLDTPCLDHYCEQLCWFTQFAFSISTIVLLVFYASYDHPAPFVNTFFVQAIAAIAYFVKASHAGDLVISDVHIPFVRYVDWITTTPLMLYELCHIAHAESHVIVMVLGCDIITLFLGISSAVIDQEKYLGVKYTLFIIAIAFYVLMVCTLITDVAQPLYDEANDHSSQTSYSYAVDETHHDSSIKHTIELFDSLEVLTIVSWSFYPLAVLLGRAHFGIITQSVEDGFICILDIISKIGMEGMIIAYAVKHYDPSDDSGH